MPSRRLSAIEVAELLAAKAGLTVEQAKALLQAQAELAYARAEDGFPIPGIGRFGVMERFAREMVMQFGPQKGQTIQVPASRKLTFVPSRVAKDMVLGPPAPTPDLFKEYVRPDLTFSVESTRLADASLFISDLGKLTMKGEPVSVIVHRLADFTVASGRIVAADLIVGGGRPFVRTLPTGKYPLALIVVQIGKDQRVAFAIIRFSKNPAAKWEMAAIEGQRGSGYGVDSGTGSFSDATAQQIIVEAQEADTGLGDEIVSEMRKSYATTRSWLHIESPNGTIALFSSGYGDGSYSSYFGLDSSGNPAALVTDFGLIDWNCPIS